MPGIEWVSTLDNSAFMRSANEMQTQLRQMKSLVESIGGDTDKTMEFISSAGQRLAGTFQAIASAGGVAFSVAQIKSFASKVAETHAYFQDINSSMKVFLGSEKAATEFTNKLKDYAYYNMFDFADLANASKQMIAYGHSVDTIIPRLDQLSNVARGTSAPLMEMVNAYNRAKNLGGVGARDLQSWAAKGLVIKDILKEMGEEVKGTSVTFEQLNRVLDHVTGEGGMFHNLMGEQMNNISAEQGQLEDTLDAMYDEIGKKYEDVIVKWYKMKSEVAENYSDISFLGISFEDVLDSGVKVSDFLLENYKSIASVLATLITVYGEYRAALVLTNAYNKAQQNFLANTELKMLQDEIDKYRDLTGAKKDAAEASLAEAVAEGRLTEAQAEKILLKKQELESLQVEKELVGVNQEINRLKALKLDEDLQEKVATQQLTMAQAEEIQKRRAVLISLEEEIKKRKEARQAKLDQSIEENNKKIDLFGDVANKNSRERTDNIKRIGEIDKEIASLTEMGGEEERINNLLEERASLEERNSLLLVSQEKTRKNIANLEDENERLLKEQADIQLTYGTKEERLDEIRTRKALLEEELSAQVQIKDEKDAALKIAEDEHANAQMRLDSLRAELEKQQEINRERSASLTPNDDLSSLSSSVDVAASQEQAAAAAEETAAEEALAAAEQVEATQGQISNLTKQEGNIISGTATTMTAGEAAALNGLTAAERIEMITKSSSNALTRTWTILTIQAKEAMNGLKTAIMTNPLGILVGAITIALPYILQLINDTDEAAESERKFGDAVEKETSQVKSLYSVLLTAGNASKVAKETAAELKGIAEQYGVTLSEEAKKIGNETILINELKDKREELIDAIRREAIERERANQISDEGESNEGKIEEFKKDFVNALPSDLSDSFKGFLKDAFTDEEIERIGRAKDRLDEMSAAFHRGEISQGRMREEQERYFAEEERIEEMMKERVRTLAKVEGEEGKYDGILDDVAYATRGLARDLAKQSQEHRNTERAIAESALAMSEEISVTDAAKVSIDALNTRTQALITLWNNAHPELTLKVHYDDSEIPAWIKGMALEELKRSIAVRQQALNGNGNKVVKYGNRILGKNAQTARELAIMQQVAQDKSTPTPKPKPTITPTPRPTKTNHKGGSGNEWNAAEHKANAEEALEEWKEELEDFTTDLINDVTDMNIANLQDSADKTLQEIAQSEKKEIKALEDSIDNLIEKKKATDKKVWMEGGKDRKDYQYKEKTREEYLQEIYAESPELQGTIASQRKAISEKYAKEREKANEEKTKAMRDYLKEYGDELQQEAAITEDYQKRIADARAKGNEGEALLLEKKMQEELSAMRLTNLRNSAEYIRAFEDLGNTSNETLKALIKRFEDAKGAAAKSLDPHQLREYTETLQQMYDELDNRNPFKTLTNALKDLADAQKEVKDAQDIYNKVKAGEVVINQTTGNAYTEAEASERLANAKDRESKVYNKLTKASLACADKLNQFAATLNNLGDMVGGALGDSLGALGGVLGSAGSAFENIKNIKVNATGIEKVLGQFSAVAGTVSAMVEMNRQLDKLLPDTESLYEHYAAKQRELNEKHMRMIELEIEQLEQRLNAESWFYGNGLTQLKKNAELNAQYAKAYGDIAAMPQEIYKNSRSGFSKWAPAIIGAIVGIVAGVLTFGAGAGPGAALGAAIGSAIGGTAIGATLGATVVAAIGTAIFSGVGAALGNAVRAGIDGITYDEGQTAAINNMRVQTRHKNFFHSEKTQDLQSWVKENWGQDLFEDVKGVQLLDPEVAKKLLEDGPTLVGETRETLEQLLEYSEKIREFIDQIHEYVSEAFGPLVDNLADALWNWLTDGKDVLDSFREYAADTFKNIAQDALKAMITKNIFEPFQEQLEDLTIAFSTGQIDETAYMAAVGAFAQQAQDSIQTQLPFLQNAAEVINMAMQNAGIDMTGQTKYEQQASQGGWEAMGQDTADELNGRFTALQIAGESINRNTAMILSTLTALSEMTTINNPILTEMRDMLVNTNVHLDNIATFTKRIPSTLGSTLSNIINRQEDIYNAIRKAND